LTRDRNITLVYATIFLLGTAYGASLSVTPLQLTKEHFSERDIGTLAIWFASGIVVMSIPAGALIRRLTAKTTLIAALVSYALAVALFPLQTTYVGTGVVRMLDGAASVAVWVSCETVLLARAEKKRKALVMSYYAMAIAIGYVAGSGLARLVAIVADYKYTFFAAAALSVVTAITVASRIDPTAQTARDDDESPTSLEKRSSGAAILWRIKLSCAATFAYGYFQASVVLFLPLYLVASKHVRAESTILITAFFASGMLIFSSLAARVADRVGHLRVMIVLAAIGVLMILGFVYLTSWPLMCVAIFVAGATLASISPVSLALQGHSVEPRDYSRANAIYNAAYALGMLMGPPISSVIMTARGGAAMLHHFAAMWLVFIVLALVFRRDDAHKGHAFW
jgi:predicted MFS family arabinose efflux permease